MIVHPKTFEVFWGTSYCSIASWLPCRRKSK